MATTENNLHIPDDLLAQAEKLAASQGRTADDLAADALKRYLAQSTRRFWFTVSTAPVRISRWKPVFSAAME